MEDFPVVGMGLILDYLPILLIAIIPSAAFASIYLIVELARLGFGWLLLPLLLITSVLVSLRYRQRPGGFQR